MDDVFLKHALKLYKSLVHCYLSKGKKELTFDDQPYINFMQCLFELLGKEPYYEEDIFTNVVDHHIDRIDNPDAINKQSVIDLIELIRKNIALNIGIHYIILPLQGSKLTKDISFSDFSFLKHKKESELLNQISSITNIDITEVTQFLEHTKKADLLIF